MSNVYGRKETEHQIKNPEEILHKSYTKIYIYLLVTELSEYPQTKQVQVFGGETFVGKHNRLSDYLSLL